MSTLKRLLGKVGSVLFAAAVLAGPSGAAGGLELVDPSGSKLGNT